MAPPSDHRPRDADDVGTAISTRERVEVQEPRPYRVLLHNDDYTTMDFVVEALVSIFGRSVPEATRIMLLVHHDGIGTAGIYPKDIAETKARELEAAAQSQGMPLRVSTEPVSEA